MKNLDQERSIHARRRALQWSARWQDPAARERKQILSECRRLPALLQVNGLIAFLLFAESSRKTDKESEGLRAVTLLSDALTDWLSGPESPVQLEKGATLAVALAEDRRLYRQAYAEAIKYATWLKRWADATLSPAVAASV